MSDVTFLFSNPRHHIDMMAPVARELRSRGVDCQLVSLAELRGFSTPRDSDLPIRAAIPFNLRRNPKVGSTIGKPGGGGARSLARRVLGAVLMPIVRRLVGRSRVLVIPNDTAFPYQQILSALPDMPVVLMQEGIRFPMPNGDAYGTGPTTMICAWGEGSRDFFLARGVTHDRIAMTGSPRHDSFDPSAWKERGAELMRRLEIAKAPLALLSNPIETQGFGSTDDRLALFERFLDEAGPVLRARGLLLVVKNHAFEDPADFARIAARSPVQDLVHVDPGSSLFSALAVCAGAVVLTSTAGIEALMFGVPIGALELPGGGFGFEYVERGAAVGLRPGSIATGLEELLDGADGRRAAAERLLERHVHDRGRATVNVANVIQQVLER